MDPSKSHQPSVVKLIVMTRHGQRAPLIISDTEKYWTCPAASLTPRGAVTMHSHGAELRARFPDFFSTVTPVAKNSVKVYSSNLNRTVLSAYYFLNGVFSAPAPTGEVVAAEKDALEFLGQFRFVRKPMKYDLLLRYFNTGISKTIQENLAVQNEKHKSAKLEFDFLAKLLPKLPAPHGMTLGTLNYLKLFYFYDYLKMYLSHELPLPHGFSMEIVKGLEFTEEVLHDLLYGNPTNVRIANYPLSLEIFEILADPALKFSLISGHDLNISGFLRLFNHIPKSFPFGAYWVLACYDDGSVEVTYHGEGSPEKLYSAASIAELKAYLTKMTYADDEEYLRELRCASTGNILKAYREGTCEAIEKEMTI